jgi:predicted PurR-regulated permease PerM
MAFTCQPAYRTLAVRFGDRHRGAAAGVVTIVSGLLALVLGTVALYVLGRELLVIVRLLQERLTTGGSLSGALGRHTDRVFEALHVDRAQLDDQLRGALSDAAKKIASAAGIVLETAGSAALTLMIALFTEYYVLLEWPRFAQRLECVLPLDPRHTRALFVALRDVGRSAFVGTVATALIQGVLAGIGYAIAGIPEPAAWGLITATASVLPVVGTFIVWVPLGAWQIAEDHVAWGIFTLIWGLLVTSMAADYVIRPRLIGKRGHGHPLLMLLALVGGIEVMGLGGLLVAPILMSLFLAALRIYERDACAAPERAGERARGH